MAIKIVKAVINGNEYNLSFNSGTGKWEATIPAPTGSSFNQEGGKYNVQLTAVNDADTSSTIDRSDVEFGDILALKVLEKQPPVIVITSPGIDAFMPTATPTIKFKITDDTIGSGGDSGINLSSLILKVDNTTVTSANITINPVNGGYECEYISNALADGTHTITIDVSDNDGNAATPASVSFSVDTVPPALNITEPADGLITNTPDLTIVGETNDSSNTKVKVEILLNGVSQGDVTVDESGNFSKTIKLAVGSNEIVITSTDSSGKVSTVTRTVVLDVSVPVFKVVSLTPNPVDAGATLTLTVEVE